MNMHSTVSGKKLALLLQTAGETQRLQILCMLYRDGTACVSEIATALHQPIANSSHHLQTLSKAGIVSRTRKGKTMCYSIADTAFATALKKLICTVSTL